MRINKRDFIMGTGFLGMASLAGAAPASSPGKTGAHSSSVFNVRDFGATGDGKTPDSNAVQKALDAAGAVSGTVVSHNVIIADPRFVNPKNRDFRFASDEVIQQTGFQPFDYA